MEAQYPEIRCPTTQELQDALNEGMATEHSGTIFDEETTKELATGNNFNLGQLDLGLRTWGLQVNMRFEIGILVSSLLCDS